MGSKTISDCIEALIGAYYVGGGLFAALRLMRWLQIDAELEPSLLEEAINAAALHVYSPKAKDIEALEFKIGYKFSVKGLLLEAITHASVQESGVGYCYQRLEFLGDSVLDLLLTLHLYESHKDIDPGELTDLRSASVNNTTFANAAVRKNLHPHLQHFSGFLDNQIKEYVDSVSASSKSTQGPKGPKTLGDLVESIAGAILIDSKLNLEEVWKIVKPLLSPIVTPDKLELPPLRELYELCDSLGYFHREACTTKEDSTVQAEITVQLKDVRLVAQGFGENKKTAKAQAALQLLSDLESKGISKRRKHDVDDVVCFQSGPEYSAEPTSNKRLKSIQPHINPPMVPISESDQDIPVLEPINMNRGGPRTSLYALCKKLQWPLPSFDTKEQKSRTAFEFVEDDGSKRTGFSSFISTMKLTIPEFGVVEVSGDPKADKNASKDSATLQMFYHLQQKGKLVITSKAD
jgi:endoribonuclease Dicer